MIARIIHYHQLKRNNLPHRLAWSMSGLKFHAHKVINLVAFIFCALGILWLISAEANSAQAVADNRVAAKLSQQASEIDELRKIVAACLKDNTGGALKIGDDWYLCGITQIGQWK